MNCQDINDIDQEILCVGFAKNLQRGLSKKRFWSNRKEKQNLED